MSSDGTFLPVRYWERPVMTTGVLDKPNLFLLELLGRPESPLRAG